MLMLPFVRELIDDNSTKKVVMTAVAVVWPKGSVDYVRIENAYGDSFLGHRKQFRNTGERYFRHILAVVTIILCYLKIHDPDLIIAAFLHDLVEDTKEWTIKRVRKKYGNRVARLVAAVTKPDETLFGTDSKAHDLATVRKVIWGGKLAIILKLADRLHNMLTPWGSAEKRHEKIKETVKYFIPLSYRVDETLLYELLLATAEAIDELDDIEKSLEAGN